MSKHTTTTRRTAIMAGVSAAAATMLPAAVAATGGLSPGADAALLALSPRFEPLFAEWRANSINEALDLLQFEAELERRTGVKRSEAPEYTEGAEKADSGYWATLNAVSNERHEGRTDDDDEETDEQYDRAAYRYRALANEILAHKATTPEGLALQVRALISSYDESWWSPDEAAPEDKGPSAFIASVASFCGVTLPLYSVDGTEIPAVVPIVAKPDPIFAAIDRHRAELRAYCLSIRASNEHVDGSPEWHRLQDAEDTDTAGALLDVLTMKPTTLAGVAAVLAHLSLPAFPDEDIFAVTPDTPSIHRDAFNANDEIAGAAKAFLQNTAYTIQRLVSGSVQS